VNKGFKIEVAGMRILIAKPRNGSEPDAKRHYGAPYEFGAADIVIDGETGEVLKWRSEQPKVSPIAKYNSEAFGNPLQMQIGEPQPPTPLRDYFAAQALANPMLRMMWAIGDEDDLARIAYGVADAMLAAREAK
jgi:hypothetical protein